MLRPLPFSLAILLATACGPSEVLSPSAPATDARDEPVTAPLFRVGALDELDLEDRAYVVGHAFAVHAYSRTLPRYIAGTGFTYVPGVSASEARVVYAFAEVVDEDAADANGDCVIIEGAGPQCPPEETDPLLDGENIDDRVNPDGTPVDEAPENDDDDGEPADDGDNAPEIPTPDEPFIDDDCETFLDPAAVEARMMVEGIDARLVLLSAGFRETELARALPAFELGRFEALGLEDFGEDSDASEPEQVKPFMRDAEICEHSPLVLDLDNNGIQVGTPANGVLFDLKEVGSPVRTAWPTGNDALLALDRDGDGMITSGGELFGNSRMLYDERRPHGFAALEELDHDRNGAVDLSDPSFARLRLWRDANRDGISDAHELVPLAHEGVTSLATTFLIKSAIDRDGNDMSLRGSFRRATPEGLVEGLMVDVWFRVQSAHAPISRR